MAQGRKKAAGKSAPLTPPVPRADSTREGDYEALYRSYVALLKQVDHLSTLREISLAVSGSIEFSETLPVIANVVQGALDVGRLTIYLLDEQPGMATPVIAKYGRDLITRERLEEDVVPLRRTPLGDAVHTRQVVMKRSNILNSAYVPLITKNAIVGVMRLDDQSDGVAFTQEDAALFHAVGAQIAVAIHNAQLYAQAVTDGLTGLYVRRYFDLRMEEEFDQAGRYGRVFSLLMFDIDHFKKFNDTHGHQTGDAVLRQFAEILEEQTRKSDICCRYGGEEMAVILPETSVADAAKLAEKLCKHIRNHEFIGADDKSLSVTTSIGVVGFAESMDTPGSMVSAADSALYRAKEKGRNRVEVAKV